MKTTQFSRIRTTLLASGILVSSAASLLAQTTPSELLEKAVYAEDTKGDIDGAITLYQQVVSQAKESQNIAAQAQLRMGECYLKKNRAAEATAAFEKVLKDYPDQKELVAKARGYLPSELNLGPIPWVDGERLQFNITLSQGTDIGTVEYRANQVESGGKTIWRVGGRMSAGSQSRSSVDVDPETFRPISSKWRHTLLGDVSAVYQAGEIKITRVGNPEATTVPAEKTLYDNEEVLHLMRRLPLKAGYKATIPVLSTLTGGSRIPVELEVKDKETIEAPAGKFDCFKVQLNIGQTIWFSDDEHRYLVKFEAGGVAGKLASIGQRRLEEPVSFHDNELGITLKTPPEWVVYRAINGQPKGQALIRTFDPDALCEDGGMRLFETNSLPQEARQSSRSWADWSLRTNHGKDENFKVRPDSWKVQNICGRVGSSFIADQTENEKRLVMYAIYVIGPKTSEFFVIVSSPETFPAMKEAFDSIVSSYRITPR